MKRFMKTQKYMYAAVAGLMVLVVGALFLKSISTPVIPNDIRKRASFPVYYPDPRSSLKLDRSTLRYDLLNKGVEYRVSVNSVQVAVTQQATPSAFADGPVYSYLLQKSHQYKTLSTNLGQVELTRPSELKGETAAIANPQGTLIFLRPKSSLSDEQWKSLVDNLIHT